MRRSVKRITLTGLLMAIVFTAAAVESRSAPTAMAACQPTQPACINPVPPPVLPFFLPDLAPVTITAKRLPNGAIKVTATFRNKGVAPAHTNDGLGIVSTIEIKELAPGMWVSGGISQVNNIIPGATVTFGAEFHGVKTACLTITLRVDKWQAVHEFNESNNALTKLLCP
jgi:hypothetical protein